MCCALCVSLFCLCLCRVAVLIFNLLRACIHHIPLTVCVFVCVSVVMAVACVGWLLRRGWELFRLDVMGLTLACLSVNVFYQMKC